ncbi:MAG: hypothetical protein K2W95_05845 [Candidatus Obscuribacterales bacterium]|nr:hypothetical protein [Candidatus Obscuribacterales bacterium]
MIARPLSGLLPENRHPAVSKSFGPLKEIRMLALSNADSGVNSAIAEGARLTNGG